MPKSPALFAKIVLASAIAAALLGRCTEALAQAALRSFIASPDVYQVIGETEHYLVIAATWRPGQRDQWHSHSLVGVHSLTDCHLRNYTPEGASREQRMDAGSTAVDAPTASQSVENIGLRDCRLVLLEQK